MKLPRRHRLVIADIENQARWYEKNKAGLGVKFVGEVEEAIVKIGIKPLRYSIRFGNWRRANLKSFPHAVFYQDEVVIFAVLHARRDLPILLQQRRPQG